MMRPILAISAALLCLTASLPALAGLNEPPVLISLDGDTEGAQGDELFFSATATDPEGQPIVFSWDFGDGFPPIEATGLNNISYIYTADGQYTLTLTIRDPGGETDSASLVITIGNGPPEITLMAVPEVIDEGGTVRAEAQATDPGDDDLTYTWDFGDGSPPLEGATVEHTYDDAGVFDVVLTVEDPGGSSDVRMAQIEVRNVAPNIPQFIVSDSTDEGAQERMSALAIAAPGDELTYRWTFSDGGPAQEGVDLVEVNYTFADDGEFTVTLTVTDDDDTSATRELPVTVVNVEPFIESAPPQIILIDRDYVYEVEATDPGDDVLTVALESGPEGMTVVGDEVRWRITGEQAAEGPWPVEISVNDGDGGIATQMWTLQAGFVDLDEDGVPDDCEIEHGLDPNDPGDALQDPDQDGRTNREECNDGSNPVVYNGPTAPEVLSPVNLARVDSANPSLTVENATDPDGDPLEYEFVVYADEAFSEVVTRRMGVGEGVDTTSWAVSLELTENTEYWWRARASDPYVSGGFSTGGSMFVDVNNDAPGIPTPIAPMGSTDVVSPEFSVDVVTDPEGDDFVYRFEVYSDAELTEVVASWTDSEPVSSPAEPLTDDRAYFWRAQSEDEFGVMSEWSAREAFHVNVENQLPPAPVITAPEEGAMVGTDVTLVWEPVVEPDNEPVTYDYQVSRDEAFTRSHDSGMITGTTVELTDLAEDVIHYVRVRALDPAGAGPYASSTFLVNAENTPPTKPVLLEPIGVARVEVGAPPNLDDVTLRFQEATDIDGDELTHTVTVMDDAGDPVMEVEAESGEVAVALEGGRYAWNVYARDDEDVRGEVSATEEFVVVVGVNAPPSAPVAVAPVDDAEADLSGEIELVVANGSDPEDAPLTYMFAVYTSSTLSEPVWTSEALEEGAEGQTVAVVPARTLESNENERFFWHAWAIDDNAAGSPSETATFARAVIVVTPDEAGDGGCGCRTATPSPTAPWFLLLLAGAALLLRRRRADLRRILASVAVAVVAVGVALPAEAEAQTKKEFVADSEILPVGGSFVRGAYDAPVTIVEFSDFQCPYCARVQPTLRKILDDYPGKVRLVFKHYPLPFHKDAPLAHEAALAAGAQGKFWEMHDLIFANQRKLKRADLDGYAVELGLDMTQFRAELDQRLYKQVVETDTALTTKVGVRGTPAFFVNGKFMSGAQPYAKFKTAVDEELAALQGADGAGGVYADRVTKNWKAPADRAPKRAPARAVPDNTTVYKVPLGKSPIRGSRKAEVTIVVFSEFQCPFCNRAAPTLRALLDEMPNVRLVFKHNPLPFHKDARLAAIAAEAAHRQGKFWEMHDLLFQNHKALKRENLIDYAAQLGLNRRKFAKALDDKRIAAVVDADMALAQKLGARGVPAFFVDGVYFAGARPKEAFRKSVREALLRSHKLRKRGLKGDRLYRALMKDAVEKKAAAPSPARANQPDPNKIYSVPVPTGAPARGPSNAKVTIVKFGDFQCPFCSRAMRTMVAIEQRYKGQVRIVYRHRPLPFHKDAKLAAQASMAAHEQGMFWEYAELLYANQRAMSRDQLVGYAKQLQLDMGQFVTALDSGKYAAYVDSDDAFAPTVDAKGTPTFFINGRRVVGAQPEAAFAKVIDEELAK